MHDHNTVESSPTVVARARVARVWRPCPTFARIAFRGAELEDFGTPGSTFDQRIKVMFPTPDGHVPDLSAGGLDGDWYAQWLALPEQERGPIRTYSIRDIRVDGRGTEVILDFVLHSAPGATGPASRWAEAAAQGDEVVLVGPRRGRFDGGGIEFSPADAQRVLLAGDETAAPAIARILEDAEPDLVGDAFIELPGTGEPLPIAAPAGVQLHWLGRKNAKPGALLVPTVMAATGDCDSQLAMLGAPADWSLEASAAETAEPSLVWETPAFSALGESLERASSRGARSSLHEWYYWIAGESRFVTLLRRHLVRDLGIPRGRVAFMGYWREGIAMK